MLPKIYAISNVLQRMDLRGEFVLVYCHIQNDYSFFMAHCFVRKCSDDGVVA